MGAEKYIFWSEIGSGFGESGDTPPPRIPRSTPRARVQCNGKDRYAICSYSSLKKGRLCSYVRLLKALFDIQRLGFEITWQSSSARQDSPCADSPDRNSGFT